MMHEVFISYKWQEADQHIAREILYSLEENNIPCWMAPRNLNVGASNISQQISEAIKTSKIVVVVLSKDSERDDQLKNEMDIAFSNEKTIIFFNTYEYMYSNNVKHYLKDNYWINAYPEPEKFLKKLAIGIFKIEEESRKPPFDLPQIRLEDVASLKNDNISLKLLLTPFYWLSFLYMGKIARKNSWKLMGLIYFITSISIISLSIFYHKWILFAFIVLWIVVLAHGISIRNEFLTIKAVLEFDPSNDELFEYLYDEFHYI